MNNRLHKYRGMSLIELMIAIAIGSLLMIGLVSTFQNSSETKRELERAGQLIENGRYAINLLSDDIRHAGFYGALFNIGDPLAAMPDPCVTTDLAALQAAMAMPIAGYNADTSTTPFSRPNISATTCGSGGLALLTNANLEPGSDILVIRRASTSLYKAGDASSPADNIVDAKYNQEVFLVANSLAGTLQQAATNNNLDTDAWTTARKYPHRPASTSPTKADTRKYDVHIYFIAPCSIGNGANGVCDGSESEANSVPTLKRLELKAVDTNGDGTGDALTMEIIPLVEGVEYFKVEYGIDNSPTTINPLTRYTGDGIPDAFVLTPAAVQDWQAVVAVKVYIVARTLTQTRGYSDQKSFVIGTVSGSTTTIAAAGDEFRRNSFTAEIRPTNMSGRREIPE
jgi:type IV pilus assembly protein PilW